MTTVEQTGGEGPGGLGGLGGAVGAGETLDDPGVMDKNSESHD